MRQYLDLLKYIMENGTEKSDRTGTGTKSIFGTQMRFNLQEGFPLVTTKKVHFKSVVHELIWLLSGNTNIKYLQDNGIKIWDEWADENGNLGPVYGKQWRKWHNQIDQIKNVIEQIKTNPESRRLIVTAWNPTEIDQMALAPCHCFFQFNCRPMTWEQRINSITTHEVSYGNNNDFSNSKNIETLYKELDNLGIPKYYLDCQLYMRSNDIFLGCPFNIASYALLTHMIAQVTNTVAGELVYTGGDSHIYSNHYDQVKLQLTREPYSLPKIKLNPHIKNIDDFKYEDIELIDYKCHPTIKAPVAV